MILVCGHNDGTPRCNLRDPELMQIRSDYISDLASVATASNALRSLASVEGILVCSSSYRNRFVPYFLLSITKVWHCFVIVTNTFTYMDHGRVRVYQYYRVVLNNIQYENY